MAADSGVAVQAVMVSELVGAVEAAKAASVLGCVAGARKGMASERKVC